MMHNGRLMINAGINAGLIRDSDSEKIRTRHMSDDPLSGGWCKRSSMGFDWDYPLLHIQTAIANHQLLWENPLLLWPF